jgi:hypothetical protein
MLCCNALWYNVHIKFCKNWSVQKLEGYTRIDTDINGQHNIMSLISFFRQGNRDERGELIPFQWQSSSQLQTENKQFIITVRYNL